MITYYSDQTLPFLIYNDDTSIKMKNYDFVPSNYASMTDLVRVNQGHTSPIRLVNLFVDERKTDRLGERIACGYWKANWSENRSWYRMWHRHRVHNGHRTMNGDRHEFNHFHRIRSWYFYWYGDWYVFFDRNRYRMRYSDRHMFCDGRVYRRRITVRIQSVIVMMQRRQTASVTITAQRSVILRKYPSFDIFLFYFPFNHV